MKILVIAAMAEEAFEIKNLFTEYKEENGDYIGNIYGKNVVLTTCGIGKVNAAMITTEALIKYKPDFVINTGSAGALNKDLKVGDVVVSTDVCHHDVDATAFGYELGQVPQMPHTYISEDIHIEVHHKGMMVSGDTFVTDVHIDKIITDFPDAYCCDMEASAIAQVCHAKDVPFVIARSISDQPFNKENNMDFKEFLPIAAKNSAAVVSEIIKNKK
jgi:adenosylhomocysteine nucleosidase